MRSSVSKNSVEELVLSLLSYLRQPLICIECDLKDKVGEVVGDKRISENAEIGVHLFWKFYRQVLKKAMDSAAL